jgi:hypothetical protein
MLVTRDSIDGFHPFPADALDWTEAVWFGTAIPDRAMSIYVYHWFRPALGIYGGGCIIWDKTAELPWDAPIFQYDVNRPIPGALDLLDLQLDNGARIRSIREGMDYEISFRNTRVSLQLTFTALTDAHITDRPGISKFFAGHLDQPGRYRGHVELEGLRYEVDSFGIRDRSWGPGTTGDDTRLGYFHGASRGASFLGFSHPDADPETVFTGYLTLDGQRRTVRRGHRQVHSVNGRLARIFFEMEDVDGRVLAATGTPLNQFSYMSYPNLLSRHYLMKWELPSGAAFGEEQDLWSLPLWRAKLRAASGRHAADTIPPQS